MRRVVVMVGLHSLNAILLVLALMIYGFQDGPAWVVPLIILLIAWQITKVVLVVYAYRSRRDSGTM
jgi:hypothetical protein